MKSHTLLLVVLCFAEIVYANPVLPTIPARTNTVTSFGAVGDGITTNTTAIQNAIKTTAIAGGGTVEFPAGTYISGPFSLSNSINIQLDSGAILRMLPFGQYPGGASPPDFITANTLHDLEFSGSGAIDGQAENSGWWTNHLSTSARPTMIALSKVSRVWFTNVTLENSPSMHMTFKSSCANITIQGITISADGFSPNTDGIDLIGTNCLVQDCSISDGDDNIAFGSTGGTSWNTLVTNCAFGTGHGLSIGGNTSGGVSNLTVINCTFNQTQYGIRMKSDTNNASGGEGGIAQNLFYYNIGMTNITFEPILIYSYYNEFGTPTANITPAFAAAQPVPPTIAPTTAIWRNIVISNLTATVSGAGTAGIIWGRTEMPVTNVLLQKVNITAPTRFGVYNARQIQFVDSQITVPAGTNTYSIFNAGLTLSNSTPNLTTATMNGLTSTNSLALINNSVSMTATDIFGCTPLTLSSGSLTVGNDLVLPVGTLLNFGLGSNAATIFNTGNLTLNGNTINMTNSGGLAPGSYTLFNYAGSLSGALTLGSAPTNFNYAIDTSVAGKVNLNVTSTGPSLSPVSMVLQKSGTNLQLSWPSDHIGWKLEAQTNDLNGTNWTILNGSPGTNLFLVPINPTNGSVFLRLVFPGS